MSKSDFQDIANRNPSGAKAVINSFNYEITDSRDLAKSLDQLVYKEGIPALKQIMAIHPDKDIILEFFGGEKPAKKGCGCGGACSGKNDQFSNINGGAILDQKEPQKDHSTILAHQTNAIIIVAALFVATALIIKRP